MNTVRKALLAIAGALLTLAFAAGTAHANPPSTPQCRVEFVSLTATQLWHSSGQDWMWFVIDGDYYPGNTKSIAFYKGTVQAAGTFNDPVKVFSSTGTATFQVVLDRTWPTANLVIDSNPVSCTTATGSGLSLRFSDGRAIYDLKYNASLV
ncbi:MAG: hypothetical protein J2P15_15565 [Micromonosporaceae bacterium]|nr:hypothetical protein [Micromonosporaceae bacterium]